MYSKYLFIKRIFLSNLQRLNSPYKLTFALTYKCNLKCKTCLIWTKETKSELTTNEIEKFFKRSNRFSWIDLTGGEIFLREDLLNIFEIIFKYCRYLAILHFPTNGQLTERIVDIVKKISKFKKNFVFVITISMDGPEEIHNQIRGTRYAWENSLKTFIGLKKLGLKFVYLGCTLSQYNSGKLQNMVTEARRYYSEIDYCDFHINIANNSEHYLNNTSLFFPLDDSIMREIKPFSREKSGFMKNFLENRYFKLIPEYFSSNQMPLKCQALSCNCFIDPYGDIYPCIIYGKKISNIRDINYDLYSFWNEEKALSIRKEILNKKCRGCWTPCEAYPAILGSIVKTLFNSSKRSLIQIRK